MVDQHAAHERILYETLRRAYQSTPAAQQAFLIPLRLEVSVKDGRMIRDRLDRLNQMGLEMEHFGGSTFLLRSVPAILVDADWEAFLGDLIPILEEEKDLISEAAVDRVLNTMACHGALRSGKKMSEQEMEKLLKQLDEMDIPTHCPHGRPVFKKFSTYEIEKMFKRVV
jgi:DNA mismatch repair protein MutL